MGHMIALPLFGGLARLLAWAGLPAHTEYMRLALALPWFLSLVGLMLRLVYWNGLAALLLALLGAVVVALSPLIIYFKDDVSERSKNSAALR